MKYPPAALFILCILQLHKNAVLFPILILINHKESYQILMTSLLFHSGSPPDKLLVPFGVMV